jgi:hypothetical protein
MLKINNRSKRLGYTSITIQMNSILVMIYSADVFDKKKGHVERKRWNVGGEKYTTIELYI